MAAPTTMHGRNGTISINGSSYEGQVTTWSATITNPTEVTTTMGNEYETREQKGIKDFTGSVTAKFDNTNSQQSTIVAALTQGNDIALVLGTGNSSGDETYAANVKITELPVTLARESIIEVSFPFEVSDGVVTIGVVA